ncbi:MAG: hypothetical protein H8F28_03380 [Fibrella sp.]|nr:hypothetical protein [Armatimonadota bacterium]
MLILMGLLLALSSELRSARSPHPPAPLSLRRERGENWQRRLRGEQSDAASGLPPLPSEGEGGGGVRAASPKYPRYTEMQAKIKEWKRRYPTLIHETVLGKTVEGRSIPLLRLSDDAAPDAKEPGVLMVAGIHPRESQPPVCLLWLADELLSGYGKDERVTRLLRERQIYLVPVLNVDGKIFDETAKPPKLGQDWRKNRRKAVGGGGTSVGVDLNRNFPVRWGGFRETDALWKDRTNRVGANIYEGPSSLSEPESKALADFFAAHAGDVRLFVDLHSPLRKILFPNYLGEADADRYEELAAGIQGLQEDRPYTATEVKRDAEPPDGSRPGNTGLSYTYAYYVHGIYGFNIEIGLNDEKDESATSGDLAPRHYPPLAGVRAEYEANIREPLLYLLDMAGGLTSGTRKVTAPGASEQDGPLLPGATVSWKPVLSESSGFAVLTSESPAIVVQSELRVLPIGTGFTLRVAGSAKPGTVVPCTLIVWDRERNRSVRRFTLTVAGSGDTIIPKDGVKK